MRFFERINEWLSGVGVEPWGPPPSPAAGDSPRAGVDFPSNPLLSTGYAQQALITPPPRTMAEEMQASQDRATAMAARAAAMAARHAAQQAALAGLVGPSAAGVSQAVRNATIASGMPQMQAGFPPGLHGTLTIGQPIPHNPGANFPTGAKPMPAKADATKPALTGKPSDVIPFVHLLLNAKRPPFVWGAPGIGKSQLVKRAASIWYAQQTGGTVDGQGRVHASDGKFVPASAYFRDVRLVLLDPVDLRGLPRVENGVTSWAAPGFLPQQGCGPTVVFLDELNRAPTLVQNAALSLVLDRHVGEYVAPENVVFVAAGNRESDGGGVTKLIAAQGRRFVHIDLEPDLDDWSTWALQNDVDPMVVAFLRFRPEQLNRFVRDERTSPNPRSWEFVSDIAKQQPPRNIERLLVAGAVGQEAAVDYMSFVELYRALPSIDAILMDPKNAKVPGPTEVGTLWAVSSALAHRAKADNFGRVLTYLERLPREYLVYTIRDATLRDPDLARTPEFTRFAVANADLL